MRRGNFSIKVLVFSAISVLFIRTSPALSYPWPIKASGSSALTATPQVVRDNIGSFRVSNTRFHDGVDIIPMAAYGISVYAAMAGTNTYGILSGGSYNENIRVGNVQYLHIRSAIASSLSVRDAFVPQGSLLGSILRPENFSSTVISHDVVDHVHFREYNQQDKVVNPLNSLNIYTDSYSPIIDSLQIFPYNDTSQAVTNLQGLYGKYDFLVGGYDPVLDTDNISTSIFSDHPGGSEYDGNVMPYRIGYQILSSDGTEVLYDRFSSANADSPAAFDRRPSIMFSICPPNINTEYIHNLA
jgi:hypothetical protein